MISAHLLKTKKMKTGLFFGSFNPIHIGHMAISNYILSFSDVEQLWFIISPQNPFKAKKSLLADYHRLELVRLAIGDNPKMQASNIEFSMPQPSYTVDTLARLSEKFPQHDFSLIMGGDNLKAFHKWKNFEEILKYHKLLVYPRPEYDLSDVSEAILSRTEIVQAPFMEISSSFIRNSISQGKDIRYFMPKDVSAYVDEMNFYK